MSILRYVLVKAGLSERRKDGRISAHGLDVSYRIGRESKYVKVKDISATGVYVVTAERIPPGTPVQLTLKKRGLLNRDSWREVRLRTQCVRQGEDGVGLTFVSAPDRAADWSRSMALSAELLAGSHPVRLFRSTKALAFLIQIAPSAEAQVLKFLGEINSERAERVLEILIRAEELLASRNSEPQTAVSPGLLQRILEYGSKASDEDVQQCWAGLLASCCIDTQNETIGRLVILLSRLDHDHLAILTAGCTMAARAGWQAGFVFPSELYCPADEIRNISGIRNPAAVEHNLNHLNQLGLTQKTVRPLGCAELEQVNITPTALGLQLYARCCGEPNVPEVLEPSSPRPEPSASSSRLEMVS